MSINTIFPFVILRFFLYLIFSLIIFFKISEFFFNVFFLNWSGIFFTMSLSVFAHTLSVIYKLSILFFNFVVNLTLSLDFEISRQCLRYFFKIILLIAIISCLRVGYLLRFSFHPAFVLPAHAILADFILVTIIVAHFLNLYFSFASPIFLGSLLILS